MTAESVASSEPFVFSPGMSPGAKASAPTDATESIVRQTRREIADFVREVAESAASTEMTPQRFWGILMDRTHRAMAAEGVVVWRTSAAAVDASADFRSDGPGSHTLDAAGDEAWPCRVVGRCGTTTDASLVGAPDRAAHDRMLGVVIEDCQPVLVPPSAGPGLGESAANPTRFPVAVVPIRVRHDGAPEYLLEVFLESGGGITTQRGYLRFVAQMADLAGEFLRAERLRCAERERSWGRRIDRLVAEFQACEDPRRLEVLAVDGIADLFGFARVGYVATGPGTPKVIAVSHVDRVDQSSPAAQFLIEAGETELNAAGFWIAAGTAASNGERAREPNRPDAGEASIHGSAAPTASEVREEQVRRGVSGEGLAVVAVTAPDDDWPLRLVCLDQESIGPDRGQDVPSVESDGDASEVGRRRDGTFDRAELAESLGRVSRHFFWAMEHHASLDAIPGGRVLASLGAKRRSRPDGFWFGRGLAAVTLVTAVLVVMFFPVGRIVRAPGTVIALDQQNVCAHCDAVVDRIHVDHGDTVSPGAPLVTLRDDRIAEELATLVGRKAVLQNEQVRWRGSLVDGQGDRPGNQEQAESRLRILATEIAAVENQIRVVRGRQSRLVLRADREGTIDAWQIRQRLQGRPLRRGERILSVIASDSRWVVDAFVPENRVRHLRMPSHASEGQNALSRQNAADDWADDGVVRIAFAAGENVSVDGRIRQIGPVVQSAGELATVVRIGIAGGGRPPEITPARTGPVGENNNDKSRTTKRQTATGIRRAGAPVDVMFHCGSAPLAELLFQDAIDSGRVFWSLLWGNTNHDSLPDQRPGLRPSVRGPERTSHRTKTRETR